MENRAASLDTTVVATADDPALMDQDRPDRNPALGQPGLRFGDRCVEVLIHRGKIQLTSERPLCLPALPAGAPARGDRVIIARMSQRYDAIVIGTGQAGPGLCGRLDREGLKTAVIERRDLGGTCLNTGCIPTKTMVASARAAHIARRGGDYGFIAGEIRVDMAAVKERKDSVVGHYSNGLAKWMAGMKNVTLISGHARFTGPRQVSVNGGETLEADRIFINGTAMRWPDSGASVLKRLANARALTPRSLAHIDSNAAAILYGWYRDGYLHTGLH